MFEMPYNIVTLCQCIYKSPISKGNSDAFPEYVSYAGLVLEWKVSLQWSSHALTIPIVVFFFSIAYFRATVTDYLTAFGEWPLFSFHAC